MGGLLFRWRSYLPLVVLGGLVWGIWTLTPDAPGAPAAKTLRACIAVGLLLAGLGLALRTYAVGHAPQGTSGRHRTQHAAQLNTFGIYSVVRHPLYLGNVLVWLGVSLTSGWLPGALASGAAGALMFALIVRHEDAYLGRRFGAEFAEWAKVTPAFLPRLSLWRPGRRAFEWGSALASEYSTLHSIGLTALTFAALRGLRGDPLWRPSLVWWILFAANSGLYLVLRIRRLRRKRRILAAAQALR